MLEIAALWGCSGTRMDWQGDAQAMKSFLRFVFPSFLLLLYLIPFSRFPTFLKTVLSVHSTQLITDFFAA